MSGVDRPGCQVVCEILVGGLRHLITKRVRDDSMDRWDVKLTGRAVRREGGRAAGRKDGRTKDGKAIGPFEVRLLVRISIDLAQNGGDWLWEVAKR